MKLNLRLIGSVGKFENIEELEKSNGWKAKSSVEKFGGFGGGAYSDIIIDLAIVSLPFLANWIYRKLKKSEEQAKVVVFKNTNVGRITVEKIIINNKDTEQIIEKKLKEMLKLNL